MSIPHLTVARRSADSTVATPLRCLRRASKKNYASPLDPPVCIALLALLLFSFNSERRDDLRRIPREEDNVTAAGVCATVGSPPLWAYYNCDTSTIRVRFEHDSATTRYNTLRGFSCARIRESVVGVSCMLIDSSMHTAFTLYLYRPTLHRMCEYARNCLYKRN